MTTAEEAANDMLARVEEFQAIAAMVRRLNAAAKRGGDDDSHPPFFLPPP